MKLSLISSGQVNGSPRDTMDNINFAAILKRIPNYEDLPDDDGDICGSCGDYGNVIAADGKVVECPMCRRHRLGRSLDYEMRNWEGWPPPNMSTLAGFEYTPTRDAARSFLREGKREPSAILFTGNFGRGKTLFSLAILREHVIAGVFCTAFCFPELIGKMKRFTKNDAGDDVPAIDREKLDRRIQRADFILCDEVGREPQSGNKDIARDFLSRLIQSCYLKKTLIITTNLTGAALTNYLDGYMKSRLFDPRWLFAHVTDTGPDLRRKK